MFDLDVTLFWWFWDVESFEYFCNQWQMLAQAQGGVKSNLERREVERSVRAEPSRSWVHFGLSAKLGPSFLLSCQSLEQGEKWDPRLWLVKTSGSSSMIGSLRIKRCAGEVWLESQHSALMENIKFVQKRLFFILLWWVKLARYPLSRSLLNFWIRGWGKLLLSPLAVYKLASIYTKWEQ